MTFANEAIASFAVPFSRVRKGTGQTVDGRYVPGTDATPVPARGVIWPSTPRELSRFAEGVRSKEWITIGTSTELRTVETSGDPDVVVYQGRRYEVQSVAPWTYVGSFIAMCLREGQT